MKKKLTGKSLILSLSSEFPSKPGIYKMINNEGKIIYIGKAKNLKNRITSYANCQDNTKTMHMVNNISEIQFTITNTEEEALLLEADNIKKEQPKYNILLKDDKLFPFIKIDLSSKFPRVYKYRDRHLTANKELFGPYASASNVEENIKTIQDTFKIRTCNDTYFKNRTSPCILYQIKKCSAPCVNKITTKDYNDNIAETIDFLNGNVSKLKNHLINKMSVASSNFNYEQALILRDKIKALNVITSKQHVILDNNESADFITILNKNNEYIIKIFFFKYGRNHGSLDFFPEINLDENLYDVIELFLIQFYNNKQLPTNIYLDCDFSKEEFSDLKIIQNSLIKDSKKLNISVKNYIKIIPKNYIKNSLYLNILSNLHENAELTLEQHIKETVKWQDNIDNLQLFLGISQPITRIEVYDNSHLYGTFSLGAMICADVSGFNKKDYRIFDLKDDLIKGNDDYGILKHILTRRINNLKNTENKTPSLMIIDGGKGQLSSTLEILKKHSLEEKVFVMAVSKGENRNAGEETLLLGNGKIIKPNKFDPNLHFIQHLRNEVHNFAIKTVRKKKLKTITKSSLDSIPGIGAKRKRDLLNYFISIDKIKEASVKELIQVSGISKTIAQTIHDYFK